MQKGRVKLRCNTKGSSIAYLLSDKKIEPNLDSRWKLYYEPIKYGKAKFLYVMANRIGFSDSKIIEKELVE